jgi:hypothetical protein
MGIVTHLLSLLHGLAAAFVSVAVFYIAGLLLMPRRWPGLLRWSDHVFLGLTFYVLLCWIATSARAIPVSYVMLVFGGVLWALASLRFRWLQSTLGAALLNRETRRWLADFSIFYVLAYVLVRPSAGSAVLTLSPEGSLDLVTYARYARNLLAFGTASVDLATFDYFRSPASAFLLAWHSLPFLGDPLDAAMPALFMLAALFGMIAAGIAASLCGLSRRASLVIGAIALCAPMFRWTLDTYSLGELLAATAVIYLTGVIGSTVASRVTVARSACLLAGGLLLYFAARAFVGSPGAIVSGIVEMARHFSPLAVFGLPGRAPAVETSPDVLRPAAIVMLPFVPLAWTAAAYALRRFSIADRVAASDDRRLARALVVYVAAAVVVGNVAQQAIRSREAARWPGGWRQLGNMGRMPFRAVTLKVADEANGLSTLLAMYYMPGRKTSVIGRGVASDDLPFETVSRQQPMFIHNFGCAGVGHEDVVSAPGVGCLLMAPPSMTVGTSYPFNRTFLFIRYGRMTPREPGGRWNTQPTLNMRLTVDPERVPMDREMYVNFQVSPFLPEGAPPLRLMVRWGNDRRGQIALGEKQWLSLAVSSSDWSGNRLWNLPVSIDFPDGRTILFEELSLTESPRGVVAQPVL